MLQELMLSYPWFIYLMVGVLSLIVGSFLNVVIYRLPRMLHAEFRQQCLDLLKGDTKSCSQDVSTEKSPKINLFLPRSFCPSCHSLVKAWQNIPLISYLLLKGRCHHCKTPISIRYPLIELLTLCLSLYATWHFGFTFQLVFALLAIALLIPLICIDIQHQLLPDCLTLSLLWIGLIANTQQLFTSLPNAVFSAAGAYLALWLFVKLFYLMTHKIGMGNGDFKLFAALGAWFGWMFLPFILLLSSIAGTLFGVLYLSFNQYSKETPIAFGPFLGVMGLITLFWGSTLLNYYVKWFII